LQGRRILVTGAAGQIGLPIVTALAADNEVWGIARFRDDAGRHRLEQLGCTTRSVDLVDPDWAGLPEHFDHVIHLAFLNISEPQYELAMTVNAEGTALLMSRFHTARSILVMSSCSVYRNHPDGAHPFVETDPLGDRHSAFSLAYGTTKTAQEAVARSLARTLSIPTTIARMNVSYGANGGLPAYQLDMIAAGAPVPVMTGGSWFNPIEEADINAHVPRLLDVASVPATIVNWGGDDAVSSYEYVTFLGNLIGTAPNFVETPDGIPGRALDNTRRIELIGRCTVDWRTGLRALAAHRHPALVAAAGA
jgi:nucleoside-diphosphate-sugar epimerase